MKVLDLFSGMEGWSRCWRWKGKHEVTTVDIDPSFNPTVCADILDLDPGDFEADVILASPPCEAFSVASIGYHWGGGAKGYQPKTEHALYSVALVEKTVEFIEALRPRVAVVENPRGMLRRLRIFPDHYKRVTISQCHYGEERMKPTDLWGAPLPRLWWPRPECHNQKPSHTADCCCRDHPASPRGSKGGVQGVSTPALRALIPRQLAISIMEAAEIQD